MLVNRGYAAQELNFAGDSTPLDGVLWYLIFHLTLRRRSQLQLEHIRLFPPAAAEVAAEENSEKGQQDAYR